MPLTNSDGDRFYVRLQSEYAWERSLEADFNQTSLHASFANTWEEARLIVSNTNVQ